VDIPGIQEFLPAFDNRGPQSRQIARAKSSRAGEFDWLKPVFRSRVAAFDVDMRRLAILHAIEEKPERARA
jgi:hypothetical protein